MRSKTHQMRDADEFVPDPQVQKEFNVTSMTLFRWDRDPDLGFPPKIKIRDKNYRSRRQLEKFKADLIAKAMSEREEAAR